MGNDHFIDLLPNRLIGFAAGILILLLVWYPHDIVGWFIVQAVPGLIAWKLGWQPAGFSPPPAFYWASGLWLALFWVPLLAEVARRLLGQA